MWNHHEVQPGKWDFSNENRNLPGFLELAAKHNMSVLLRPGPYVCAEWDLGGFPAYLLENATNTSISLRSTNVVYMQAVWNYFSAIAPIIKKYDSKNGGPIVLLQIEN
jgi:beta-galactosidase